jgi:hypothetical protein
MEEEFNNNNIENLGENDIYNSPKKKNKFISTRRRKEFINTDSDKKENLQAKNLSSQKKNQEESKEDEADYSKNNRISHFDNNAIERSKDSGSPLKNNITLQEKLKKIFMNRDKLNVQSSIQDIPESLKYNSDDSDDDDISILRKSINSKKSNKKENNNFIRESKQNQINNSNSNKKGKSEQDGELIFSPPLQGSFGGEEKINKNEKRRRFISYNEEEKTSNENSGSKIIGSTAGEISIDGKTVSRRIISTMKDKKEFIKVFRESIKTILQLSATAQKILWYIMDSLPINKNVVVITNDACMDACGFKNRKSVRDGIIELLDKNILTRSSVKYKYWVNPIVMFNGDRIEFIREYRYEK